MSLNVAGCQRSAVEEYPLHTGSSIQLGKVATCRPMHLNYYNYIIKYIEVSI